MKKTTIFSLLALTAVTGLFGCLPEKSEKSQIYSGPTVLEFKNYTLGQATAALNSKGVFASTAQTDSTRSIVMASRPTDTVLVQLVGPQRNDPITVTFALRSALPTGMAGTVATEGTHYNFVTPGQRTVTIPAKSSFGYILIKPIAGSLAAGTTRVIPIDLIGGSGDIKANPNFDSFFVTLRP